MKKHSLLLLFGIFAICKLEAHVDLIYPQGGEVFKQGDTVNVQWRIAISHNTLNWDLFFSSDDGSTWEPIEVDIPVGTLSYQWIVPETLTTQGRIKIVMDNDGNDYDDISENFTISNTSGIRKQITTSEIKVFPNPMVYNATIEIDNSGYENYTLTLYDSQGCRIRIISNITTDKLIFNRDNLKVDNTSFNCIVTKNYISLVK